MSICDGCFEDSINLSDHIDCDDCSIYRDIINIGDNVSYKDMFNGTVVGYGHQILDEGGYPINAVKQYLVHVDEEFRHLFKCDLGLEITIIPCAVGKLRKIKTNVDIEDDYTGGF